LFSSSFTAIRLKILSDHWLFSVIFAFGMMLGPMVGALSEFFSESSELLMVSIEGLLGFVSGLQPVAIILVTVLYYYGIGLFY